MPEDDDRAAKAARAKAMLKKRKAQKAAAGATSPGTGEGELPSRTATPAPKEQAQENNRDLSDVFAKDDGMDTSWLSSLPPAETTSPPPPQETPAPLPPTSANGSAKPLASSIFPAHDTSDSKLYRQFLDLQKQNASLQADSDHLLSLKGEADTLRQRNTILEADSRQLNALRAEVDSLRSRNSSLEENVKRLERVQAEVVELGKEKDTLVQEVSRLKSTHEDTLSHLANQSKKARKLEQQIQQLESDTDVALQNERQTISLLVSEKSSLTQEVQRLSEVEAHLRSLEHELESQRNSSTVLEDQLQQVQAEKVKFEKIANQEQARVKELSDSLRDKDHELHNTQESLNHAKQAGELSERRIRELEERIQNDDTVERLEDSLKNTQDRADELEFQLSKLKQNYATLKTERDGLEENTTVFVQREEELQGRLSELETLLENVNDQLASAEAARDALAEERTSTVGETESLRANVAELQEKLAEAAATISQNARQLQAVTNELKSANRRAEEAENTQKELQSEGSGLMKSLDEMRPKIVELTEVKLELTETVSKLQADIRNNQQVISELETTLAEATQKHANLEAQTKELVSRHERERALSTADTSDLQKAHTELQQELDAANESLRLLNSERTSTQKDAARHLNDLQRTTTLLEEKTQALTDLEQEVEVLRAEQEESQEHIDDAQNEIEALRSELEAKDDELHQLREEVASPTKANAPQSLDDELLSSLRQQHALELSSAQSQIRGLENQVFEANARSHALQKQLAHVEDQLIQLKSRPSSRLGQRSYSPANRLHTSDLRRSSISSRPNSTKPLARSIFDQNMSAETRHKRLVSLSMLKARIDSEAEASVSRPSSRASLRGLSTVEDDSRPGTPEAHSHSRSGRSQFLDDSHVFWCHSCTGDLVVL